MNKKQEEWPQYNDYYLFKTLANTERWTISLVYFQAWRKIVNIKRLKKNEQAYFKLYFKEIHARYYLRVVQGHPYVKSSRIILNFLLSKANENLRGILSGLQSYNLTVFVHAIRSQIELNALVNKFIIDKKYHEIYVTLNEDRSKIKEQQEKTVVNINTLIDKLKNDVIQYKEYYDSLSLLLHPNPSAIKFYLQAEGTPTPNKTGLFHPNIKYYFNETISSTEEYDNWFRHYTWAFLTIMEHFLILIDSLKDEFFCDNEKEQSELIEWFEFVRFHEKRILKAANQAEKKNIDVEESVNQEIENILSEYEDKEK